MYRNSRVKMDVCTQICMHVGVTIGMTHAQGVNWDVYTYMCVHSMGVNTGAHVCTGRAAASTRSARPVQLHSLPANYPNNPANCTPQPFRDQGVARTPAASGPAHNPL